MKPAPAAVQQQSAAPAWATGPRAGARLAALDALRALALLPVVVVNFAGYATLPWSGPLAQPGPDEGLGAWAVSVLVLALLQGKGICLLMFLFGYSLHLGGAAAQRLRRLAGLGVLHGALLYTGDIVSQYGLVGLWARRWRALRLRGLLRRTGVWLSLGAVLGLLLGLPGSGSEATLDWANEPPLVAQPTLTDWLRANAWAFALWLPGALLGMGPWMLGLMGLGLLAARLRCLSHPRWLPRWRALARWAGPMLVLQLAWATALAEQLLGTTSPLWSWLHLLLGAAALVTWVPWLLLRRWPLWLQQAGRQTLSLYLACSVVTVLVWCPWALGWQPGVVAAVLSGAVLWGALVALSAWATRRGWRLPAEAWLARRRAPVDGGVQG